jgi:hypothetical protein
MSAIKSRRIYINRIRKFINFLIFINIKNRWAIPLKIVLNQIVITYLRFMCSEEINSI